MQSSLDGLSWQMSMIDTCQNTVTFLSVFGLLSVAPSGVKYSEIKGSFYYQVAKLVINLHLLFSNDSFNNVACNA